MSARWIIAATALLAAPAAAQEEASAEQLADRFERALVAGDYRDLPLAEGFTYTENGAELSPWDGMWRTTTALAGAQDYPELDYRLDFAPWHWGEYGDAQDIVRVVEFRENGVQGVLAYRLVAQDGEITRIDTLPVREEFGGDRGGTLTLLQPMLPVTMDGELVGAPDPEFFTPGAESNSRIPNQIANYFELLRPRETRRAVGATIHFSEDCVRRDNGQVVTGVDDAPVLDPAQPDFRPFAMGCGEQIASGYYSNFTLGNLDTYVARENGIGIAFVRLDQPGTTLSFQARDVGTVTYPGPRGAVENADTGEQFDGRILTNMITPMSVNGVFLFKFNQAGEIQRIDAFYRGAPLGWDAVPD